MHVRSNSVRLFSALTALTVALAAPHAFAQATNVAGETTLVRSETTSPASNSPLGALFDGCVSLETACSTAVQATQMKFVFDLKSVHELESVQIFGDTNGFMQSRNFDVEIKSEAAAAYELAITKQNAFLDAWVTASLANRKARYLRITVRSDADKAVQVRELKIIAKPAASTAPVLAINVANAATLLTNQSTQMPAASPLTALYDGCVSLETSCSASAAVNQASFVFDLKREHELHAVHLFGDTNGWMVSRSFDVEIKTTASGIYQKIVSGRDAFLDNWVVATLAKPKAQFVRVTVRGEAGRAAFQVRELKILGVATGTVPLPPQEEPPSPEPVPQVPVGRVDLGPTQYSIYVDAAKGSDSNSGSSESPKKSIGSALSAARPGTAIYVRPGNYGSVSIGKDGAKGAPIKLISTVKHGAIITGNIVGMGRHYIAIDGFKILAMKNGVKIGRDGIQFGGTGNSGFANPCSDIVIQNNHISQVPEDGIKVHQCRRVYIYDNVVTDYSKMQSEHGDATEHGIDFVAVNDSVIEGNTISNGVIGMTIKCGSLNVKVLRNTLNSSLSGAGVNAGEGSDLQWCWPESRNVYTAKQIVFEGNNVYSRRGLILRGCQECTVVKNSLKSPLEELAVRNEGSNVVRNIGVRENCVPVAVPNDSDDAQTGYVLFGTGGKEAATFFDNGDHRCK